MKHSAWYVVPLLVLLAGDCQAPADPAEPATSSTAWQCRNDLEISCNATGCEAAESFTPMDVRVDDADIRAYLRRCLGPITHRVCEAADGVEALAVARAALPDGLALIIADLAMPRMGGLEFHAALRANVAFAAVPVLFVSGEPGPVPEGTLLAKPFNGRTVCAAVRAVLPST